MIPLLGPVEVRVLGCLIEKENTTPEYYPLTLNALVNACNQKSNRDPVVSYDEDTVQEALDHLREKRLITVLTGGGNRVPQVRSPDFGPSEPGPARDRSALRTDVARSPNFGRASGSGRADAPVFRYRRGGGVCQLDG